MHCYLSNGLTAHEQWMPLEKSCLTDVQSRVIDLYEHIQDLSKNSFIVSQYFIKAKTIIGYLVAIGELVRKNILLLYVLWGLGPRTTHLWMI